MSLRTVSRSRARSESLDWGLITFAVSLRGVSDLEPRTVGGDPDMQSAAGHDPASIEIVGVAPGRIAADVSARLRRGRHAHAARRSSRIGVEVSV
jgi:hypothetical protein